jgi:hypothetical protein
MDQNPKQQVVERIKSATNILVTVSNNPSVDQLAACIGFTLMLNKLGKHATAVFSGTVPSTLEFLQPDKTIEKNTDSLQDFIIALDKSKADKLRYKVEDDVVRIFITPYRTSISEKDLEFSLGDFNVDAVVALGITKKEEIDQAIVAHGRILHDATVMTVTAGEATSDVGSINWHESAASSLSEMLVSISESFQSGLLDPQMATSFLTGIVAETERFSNSKTSPKVMTMSAQLMAAGANQQLIATKLAPPEPEPAPPAPTPDTTPAPAVPEQPKADGEIDIRHEEAHSPAGAGALADGGKPEDDAEIHIDDDGNLKRQAELAAQKKAEEEAAAKAAQSPAEAAAPATNSETPPAGNGYLAGPSHKVIAPLPGQGNFDPLQPDAAASPLTLPPVQPATPPHPIDSPLPPAPAADSPLPPPAPDNQTLTQLEQNVHSPHLNAVSGNPLDEARQAVATAGLDTPPLPQAAQAIGAQHVDLQLPAADAPLPPAPDPSAMTGVAGILQATGSGEPPAPAPQDGSAMPPPPVPPPMTAPYFEPKTSHHNPYLNPNDKPSDKKEDANDAPL